MTNFAITKQNLADDGTLSDPNGDWTAKPLSNLQNDLSSVVARTGGSTDTKFEVDLSKKQSIRLVVLDNHNLTTEGEWRIEVATDSGFTDVTKDTGYIKIWERTEGFGDKPYGEFVWGGRENTDDGDTGILFLDNNVLGRYVRISLRDNSGNISEIEAGRLFIDSPYVPSFGILPGLEIRWKGAGTKRRTRGGSPWIATRQKYREARIPLDFLPQKEILGNIYEIERRRGVGGQVFVMIQPDDTKQRHRQSFLGTLTNLPTIVRDRPQNLYSTELVIEESR